jgi:antirestriction protein ArdC
MVGDGRYSIATMDVYGMITERIIDKLEAGTVPWHKPWRRVGPARNLVSKKP